MRRRRNKCISKSKKKSDRANDWRFVLTEGETMKENKKEESE
jgi:hypothetical protein